jgi:LPS sulfotransferase NodH
MKQYDFDKIERVLIRCKEYVVAMSNSYKIQGIKIPREVRELKDDLTQIISTIERT